MLYTTVVAVAKMFVLAPREELVQKLANVS